jgi:hypothetical protein
VWWLGGGAGWTMGLALDKKPRVGSPAVIVGLDVHLV